MAENCPIPNLMPLVKKVLKSDARKKIVKKVIKEDVVKAAIEKTIEAVEENNVDDEKIKRTIWVGLFYFLFQQIHSTLNGTKNEKNFNTLV